MGAPLPTEHYNTLHAAVFFFIVAHVLFILAVYPPCQRGQAASVARIKLVFTGNFFSITWINYCHFMGKRAIAILRMGDCGSMGPTHSLIHSFGQYLSSTSYVSGAIQGTGDTPVTLAIHGSCHERAYMWNHSIQ